MCELIWLSEAQMRRIEPDFPLSHGVPRVDDRRVISGIIFVIRNGLRWRDAPKETQCPHPTQSGHEPLRSAFDPLRTFLIGRYKSLWALREAVTAATCG